jgi:hypothetical protein
VNSGAVVHQEIGLQRVVHLFQPFAAQFFFNRHANLSPNLFVFRKHFWACSTIASIAVPANFSPSIVAVAIGPIAIISIASTVIAVSAVPIISISPTIIAVSIAANVIARKHLSVGSFASGFRRGRRGLPSPGRAPWYLHIGVAVAFQAVIAACQSQSYK